MALDPVTHVADEPSFGSGALEHDGVTKTHRLVFTVRVRNLQNETAIERWVVDTYALVRLGKLLLSFIDDKFVAFFALHVRLQSVIEEQIISIRLSDRYLLGVLGFPVLDPVADASLVAISGST